MYSSILHPCEVSCVHLSTEVNNREHPLLSERLTADDDVVKETSVDTINGHSTGKQIPCMPQSVSPNGLTTWAFPNTFHPPQINCTLRQSGHIKETTETMFV